MKSVFKVWNYIMIVGAIISMIHIGILVLGGSVTSDGALFFFSGILALIPVAITFIMAKAGIKGEYSTSTKYGFIVFFCSLLGIFTHNKLSVLLLFFSAIYLYMSVSLNKYKY